MCWEQRETRDQKWGQKMGLNCCNLTIKPERRRRGLFWVSRERAFSFSRWKLLLLETPWTLLP